MLVIKLSKDINTITMSVSAIVPKALGNLVKLVEETYLFLKGFDL